jgi:hypothetical protein
MKNFLLGLFIATALLSFKPIDKIVANPTTVKTEISQNCKHGQCQGTAKSTKKRCLHCVSNAGDRFCYQHK